MTDKELWEASCLTRWQVEHWTDADFAAHPEGVRRTLRVLMGLEGDVGPEPYMWVYESPGYFDPRTGGEPPYTDFSDVEKPGYFPLYRHSAAGGDKSQGE